MMSIHAICCVPPARTGGLLSNFALRRFENSFNWNVGNCHIDRSDQFGVFWVEEGSGELSVDEARVSFGPGSLMFLSPGQLNAWRFDSRVRGEIALFTEEFLLLGPAAPSLLTKMPFLYDASPETSLTLEGTSRDHLDRLFADLREEVEYAEVGQDDLVRARLTIILSHARRQFATLGQDAAPAARSTLVWRFRLALAQHFPRLTLTTEYARHLGVSGRHLNDELKRHAGRSANELIRDRAVLEAKRLLVHSSLTISEIGYQLQFGDPSYFVRFFRRLTGVTPGRYRAVADLGSPAA
jgi:AraC family transcriptional regulator, transcriptional activator of pobA